MTSRVAVSFPGGSALNFYRVALQTQLVNLFTELLVLFLVKKQFVPEL